MPTTTYRSKEDCPKPPDHIVAGMDTAVLERLSKIMGYLRMGSAQGKAGKKLKKKEKAALLLQADDARQQLKSPPGTSLATNGAGCACVCVCVRACVCMRVRGKCRSNGTTSLAFVLVPP
jgi:hypothetical protein